MQLVHLLMLVGAAAAGTIQQRQSTDETLYTCPTNKPKTLCCKDDKYTRCDFGTSSPYDTSAYRPQLHAVAD